MAISISPVLVTQIFWVIFGLESLVSLGLIVYLFLPSTRWGPEGAVGAWLVFLPPIALGIALAVFLLAKSDSTRLTVTTFLALPLIQVAVGPVYKAFTEYQARRSSAGDDDFHGLQRTLAHAISDQNLGEVVRLIPVSGDLSGEQNGETILRFALVKAKSSPEAASSNSVAIVKALLDAGVDPNVPAFGSNWPLTLAIMKGPAMTALLLSAGADPNRIDGAQRPLWWTVLSNANGRPAIESLLAHGANVSLRDAEGGPVAWAAYHKNWVAVELLIQRGAAWRDEQQFGVPVAQMLQSDFKDRRMYKSEIPKEMEDLLKRYGL